MRWRKPSAVWSNRAVHGELWWFLRHSDKGVKQYLLVENVFEVRVGNGFNYAWFFFSSCLSILQWMMWLLSRNKACTLSASPIKNPSGSGDGNFQPWTWISWWQKIRIFFMMVEFWMEKLIGLIPEKGKARAKCTACVQFLNMAFIAFSWDALHLWWTEALHVRRDRVNEKRHKDRPTGWERNEKEK